MRHAPRRPKGAPDRNLESECGRWNLSRSNSPSRPAENMESGFPRRSPPETPRGARGRSHGACAGGLAHAPSRSGSVSVAEPAASPSATGTLRRGAGLPQLGRPARRLRASPRPSFPIFHPAARPPFPRNSRHEREAAGAVSPSVVVAAAAAPAGGGPGPASGRRFLPARPGACQLLRGREEERRVQGGRGPADNTPLTLPWEELGSEGKGA